MPSMLNKGAKQDDCPNKILIIVLFHGKGKRMRRILITNDDGIEADGIIRLVKAAKEFCEVWVVAPR